MKQFLSQTIPDVETKQNAKLRSIGEKTYRVLEDLCTPQKPSNKSLEEITQLLWEHFKPKHRVVTESFKFYNAKQEESESISNVHVCLKHLASTREFGSFLKRALRDKFMCGLKDDKIQEKLLSEDKSLEEAFKMAKAMGLATANDVHIKEKEADEVNKMALETLTQCPAWGKACFKYNNKNHFSRHCKNKQRGNMSHYLQETHDMLLSSTNTVTINHKRKNLN